MLVGKENRTDFVREAVERELKRRERQSPNPVKRSKLGLSPRRLGRRFLVFHPLK